MPGAGQNPERRFAFMIGDAFPADDPVARWALSVSIILNDVGLVNRRLLEDLKTGRATPNEHMFDARQSFSQIWEAAEFLRETVGTPDIAAFVDRLDASTQTTLRRFLDMTGPESKLSSALAMNRHRAWHYPRPADKVLTRALTAVADRETEFIVGKGLARTRAAYADEVVVQFISRTGDVSEEDFQAFVTTARDALSELIDFALGALVAYLARTGVITPRSE